ncbi:glycosyltransferase [Lacisediminihabitans changchengi]|uniref:Glycosyltransferase n=1 Tax=Lacisediminihabitans changchengi TaxID=2787634 RepID=A0A934SNR3_9MICO|nr:glycosyltransferase [Lacisediminihabitans changchengi]MBK4346459.1 glycosyltransferase [Lacisediminihabitans changchengi]MBK4348913.1 glycosyltransferase [Lacisediminihabitans changchengi]
MSDPEVLVVLPTLGDRLDTLKITLDSVNEQRKDLGVTLVVVAPPGATAARELAASMGAVIVDDPKEGISAAINYGLAARTTEKYYAWVGDDDLFRPEGLVTLRTVLEATPGAVLAFGGCDYIDPEGRTITVSNAGRLATFLLPWGPDLIPHPGTMITLDALEEIGGFDRELRFAMDLDAFLKLRKHGSFVWTRRSVSAFRWHAESLTVANRLSSSREAESVKRRHLPAILRPVSGLWHRPIRWASAVAAGRVNAQARALR